MLTLCKSSAELLDEAETLYRDTREGFRDAMLEVGTLLEEFVVARVREGESMSERKRLSVGATRAVAVKEAAARLGCPRSEVLRILQVRGCVNALSQGGDVGSLSWASLRHLARMVRRTPGRAEKTKNGIASDGALTPSDRQVWVPAVAGAVELFRTAVAEGWPSTRCDAEVHKLTHPGATYKSPGRPTKTSEPVPAGPSVYDVAAESDPRDLAEMVLELIRRSADPSLVRELVIRGAVR